MVLKAIMPLLLSKCSVTFGQITESARADRSRILKQCHKPKIHMKLLVAVKEGRSGVVCDEIDFGLLEPPQHHDVLEDAARGLAAHSHQFETMSMKVQRMDVIAGVSKFEPITPATVHGVARPH